MLHAKKAKKLGRTKGVRTALLRGLAVSLIKHGKIQTTEAKAKELRKFIEPLVTMAKNAEGEKRVSASRILASRLDNNVIEVKKLISEIAPKSIYVSGKSVSGAGLTVAAEKDELGDGGWVLKAGALVLASGGIAQIDEFDKIDEEDRATLHEAMETQTISVAKAGIVAKFRTKTAILSAANPKYGRFDTSKNLAEQFEIPPTLLSRFDLIFPIVDVLDEEKDLKLAEHILSSHMGKHRKDVEVIDKEILRKYIAYARRKVFPKLTSGAKDKIKDFYVDLRAKSRESEG
jgi:replicative DNA helicase Mcm